MGKERAVCPKCISSGEVIDRKHGKTIISTCDFCNGTGYVSQELEEDYLLSLYEDFGPEEDE